MRSESRPNTSLYSGRCRGALGTWADSVSQAFLHRSPGKIPDLLDHSCCAVYSIGQRSAGGPNQGRVAMPAILAPESLTLDFLDSGSVRVITLVLLACSSVEIVTALLAIRIMPQFAPRP